MNYLLKMVISQFATIKNQTVHSPNNGKTKSPDILKSPKPMCFQHVSYENCKML